MRCDDIAVVSYLGSGSSLLGGILIELGIDYIEGYQEKIIPSQHKSFVHIPYWREHWPQLLNKYNDKKIPENALRIVKSHYYPHAFEKSSVDKVVLLVRDVRDAVLSYYHWRCGFSDEAGTLHDFLRREGFTGRRPFDDWADFNTEWLKWGKSKQIHVIRYEDIKLNPIKTVRSLLSFLKQDRDINAIRRAIENSSFLKVSKEEVSADRKIFRKGLIGEWRLSLDEEAKKLITQKAYDTLDLLEYTSSRVCKIGPGVCLVGSGEDRTDIVSRLDAAGVKHIIIFGTEMPDTATLARCTLMDTFASKHLEKCICGPVIIFDSNPEISKCLSFYCSLKNLPCIESKNLTEADIMNCAKRLLA